MTTEEKLSMVKTILGITDTSADSDITVYLTFSQNEILNWMYINKGSVPDTVTDVPARYEQVQIMSVVTGYSQRGAEGEIIHNENGINRTFTYDNMVSYIRSHVFQIL